MRPRKTGNSVFTRDKKLQEGRFAFSLMALNVSVKQVEPRRHKKDLTSLKNSCSNILRHKEEKRQ